MLIDFQSRLKVKERFRPVNKEKIKIGVECTRIVLGFAVPIRYTRTRWLSRSGLDELIPLRSAHSATRFSLTQRTARPSLFRRPDFFPAAFCFDAGVSRFLCGQKKREKLASQCPAFCAGRSFRNRPEWVPSEKRCNASRECLRRTTAPACILRILPLF